jgi:hypothetical protein
MADTWLSSPDELAWNPPTPGHCKMSRRYWDERVGRQSDRPHAFRFEEVSRHRASF